MSKERERSREVSTGPDPFSDDFESFHAAGASVEVIHGVHSHTLPLAGMTVRQAREELSERMHIDPDALAVVDGEEVSQEADFVLAGRQILNFVKPAGERGHFPIRWSW